MDMKYQFRSSQQNFFNSFCKKRKNLEGIQETGGILSKCSMALQVWFLDSLWLVSKRQFTKKSRKLKSGTLLCRASWCKVIKPF